MEPQRAALLRQLPQVDELLRHPNITVERDAVRADHNRGANVVSGAARKILRPEPAYAAPLVAEERRRLMRRSQLRAGRRGGLGETQVEELAVDREADSGHRAGQPPAVRRDHDNAVYR